MGRVEKNSLIIEIYELGPDDIVELFKQVFNKGYKLVDIVVYPGYFYGRRPGSKGIYQYSVAPLSIVLPSTLAGELGNYVNYTYIVERDAWIDTRKLDLNTFLRIYFEVKNLVLNPSLNKELVFETSDSKILFKIVETRCDEIIYFDSLNTQYSGLFHRLSFLNELYHKILSDYVSRKPREYVLSYVVSENQYSPLLTFVPQSPKPIIKYVLPRECGDQLIKYLVISLIDALLL